MTKELLMMLNNYFNDMFISMVFVTALFMYAVARYLPQGTEDSTGLILYLYRRLRRVFTATLVVAIIGAGLRIAEGSEIEEMVEKGFAVTIAVKYVLLSVIFVVSLLLWMGLKRAVTSYSRHSETA